MRCPRTLVDHRRSFKPPFCPSRSCLGHYLKSEYADWKRDGFHSNRQMKRVPRFVCKICRRGFSLRSFSTRYYAKRPELHERIAAMVVAGSANRQIARTLGCAPSTVDRAVARLGRHALLLHAEALEALQRRVVEPFTLDHFESFEFTQDWPFGVGTTVGARSWFIYAFDPAPHPRAGRMTRRQRRRLACRPARPMHGGHVGSTSRVLDILETLVPEGLEIVCRTDGHPDYPLAFRRHPRRDRLRHEVFPNPVGRRKDEPRDAAARARDEALHPADLLHGFLRHTNAHDRRETLAFPRRINAAMERLGLIVVWRNFVKRVSEKRSRSPTPAMLAGLADEHWTWRRLLSRRRFYGRCTLPEPWPALYRRAWVTPILPSNTRHDRKRSF